MSSYRALEREINIIRVIKSVRNEVHLGNVLSLERFLRFGSVSSSPISHSQKRKRTQLADGACYSNLAIQGLEGM